jgi:argininosuccinate synthase
MVYSAFVAMGLQILMQQTKKQNTHTMDLLIAVLMYLGVFASPEKLTNEEFLKTNQAQINKATEMINSGECNKTGGITVHGNL